MFGKVVQTQIQYGPPGWQGYSLNIHRSDTDLGVCVCIYVYVCECVMQEGERRMGVGVAGGVLDVFILSSHWGGIKQVLTRLSTSL